MLLSAGVLFVVAVCSAAADALFMVVIVGCVTAITAAILRIDAMLKIRRGLMLYQHPHPRLHHEGALWLLLGESGPLSARE